MDAAAFDRIVARIYEAGGGLASWEFALSAVAETFNLWGIQIVGIDKASGTLMYTLEGGAAPPEATIDYIRNYHQSNPRLPLALGLSPGEWVHDHEHFDDRFVAKSPFFQEFFIAHGGRYCSGTKILDNDSAVVLLGAMRGVGQRPLNPPEIVSFERLLGHFKIALEIYNQQRALSFKVAAAHQILERMAQPTLLVDENRFIHYKNHAASKRLSGGELLSQVRGHFCCRRTVDDQRLLADLKELLLPGNVDNDYRRRVIKIKRGVGEPPTIILLDRLLPEATMQAFGPKPLAFVILHALGEARPVDPFIVAEAFDLTPAEAQVSALLAEGMSPEQIAKSRYASITTVRSQLRSAYEKIGVSRQADLIRTVREMQSIGI